MRKLILGLTLAVGLLNSACSTQWREVYAEPSEDEVFQAYDEMNSNSSADVSMLSQLRNDDTSSLYYAKSGDFGSVISVLSFGDVSFLQEVLQEASNSSVVNLVYDYGLKDVTVIFLDALDSQNQRQFAIMLKLEFTNGGSPVYFTKITDDYEFDGSNFAAWFGLADGRTLVLRSHDISSKYGDELAPDIHLKAFIDDGNSEYPVGQFSILKGYGGV